jgi:hypothetical protein
MHYRHSTFIVMAGLDPAIHVVPPACHWNYWLCGFHVDTRVKPGHDGLGRGVTAAAH